jgi:hypothetical protein
MLKPNAFRLRRLSSLVDSSRVLNGLSYIEHRLIGGSICIFRLDLEAHAGYSPVGSLAGQVERRLP